MGLSSEHHGGTTQDPGPGERRSPCRRRQPPRHKGMPYEFAYGVVDDYSGNNYGQSEKSDGGVVTGEYRVLLPDGRTQIVTYSADHYRGYVAEVKYEGEIKPYKAHAPAPYKAPVPAYGPPH